MEESKIIAVIIAFVSSGATAAIVAAIGSIFLARQKHKYDIEMLNRKASDSGDKLLLGLAHDRIMHLGTTYIERGYVTKDEYENLHDYLYIPYRDFGGNGTARRVMEAVNGLPIRKEVQDED
jgi:hypothetical protein